MYIISRPLNGDLIRCDTYESLLSLRHLGDHILIEDNFVVSESFKVDAARQTKIYAKLNKEFRELDDLFRRIDLPRCYFSDKTFEVRRKNLENKIKRKEQQIADKIVRISDCNDPNIKSRMIASLKRYRAQQPMLSLEHIDLDYEEDVSRRHHSVLIKELRDMNGHYLYTDNARNRL